MVNEEIDEIRSNLRFSLMLIFVNILLLYFNGCRTDFQIFKIEQDIQDIRNTEVK